MFDETENITEDTQIEQEPNVQQQEENKQDNASKNFAALREKAHKLERERDEAIRQLQSKQTTHDKSEEDEFNLAPDDLAEGKHLSKVQKKIKNLEQKLSSYEQQSSASMAESRLRSMYPDIENVVSKDNLESLSLQHPELYQSLLANPDLYSKGASAYTMIKKLGIDSSSFDLEKKIAQANSNKPRPLASVSPQQGDSPLSRANAFANGLTDELRKQLYKEMIEAKKGHY